MARVLIPLAEGCEELEAVTVIDLLRRAGIEVISASLTDNQQITASRGVRLLADTILDEVVNIDFDMLVLPGGQPGTNNLNQDTRIHSLLRHLNAEGKYIAAVCAAPMVLANAGILTGRQTTCFPGTLYAQDWPDIQLSDSPVVIDNNIITSRGPGTAMDFALTLIECLTDQATRKKVEAGLVRTS